MARKKRSWEKGQFTSTVRDGSGKAVRSGTGTEVKSRDFRFSTPNQSVRATMRPKSTSRAEGAVSASTRPEVSSEAGDPRRGMFPTGSSNPQGRAPKASTGGPARHTQPTRTEKPTTSSPTRPSTPSASSPRGSTPSMQARPSRPKKPSGLPFPKKAVQNRARDMSKDRYRRQKNYR